MHPTAWCASLDSRRSWLTLVFLSAAGCSTPRPPTFVTLPPPPPEEIRAQIGSLAIGQAAAPTATEFTQPLGKGRAAGHGGWVGFWTPPSMFAGSGDGRGVIFGLLLSPVAGTAGAIYGAVAGMSKVEYAQICATLGQAAQAAVDSGQLQSEFTDALCQLPLPPPSLTPTATDPSQTTLDLSPSLIRLSGRSEIEPPLTFLGTVRIRLRRTADQSELFAAEFGYTGSQYTLREWAAHDGDRFRKECGEAWRCLSGHIAERLFLTYALPDSPAQQRVLPWPPVK